MPRSVLNIDNKTMNLLNRGIHSKQSGVAYEAFKAILRGVNESAVMCPPLKTTAAALLSLLGIYDLARSNKVEFYGMEQQFNAILEILDRYEQLGRQTVLEPHLEKLSKNLTSHVERIIRLREHSMFRRMAEGTKDAGLIAKTFRDIGILLDTFQTDVALNTDANIELILQRQNHDIIHRIHRYLKSADRASYKTRLGADDDEPRGCTPGTREDILESFKAWAVDDEAPRVYWLYGMAGTGKSSIAHTLCELLDNMGKLGGSYFCTRSDSVLRDPSRIIPTIASMLSRSSPHIRSELCQVLENHPDAATLNSLPDQFNLLIAGPIKNAIPKNIKTYKVVIIDAIDECSHQSRVESLITTIRRVVSEIPLKFFISSRPENWIEDTFWENDLPLKTFALHDVPWVDVQSDIELFLRSSLSKIANTRKHLLVGSDWPPDEEVRALLNRSDGLFIHAATAVRYIRADRGNYRQRLTAMARHESGSPQQMSLIDTLYNLIMKEAFDHLEEHEKLVRGEVVSTVVCLQRPQSIQSIASLLVRTEDDIRGNLLPFHSVIRVPSVSGGQVSIFHASFGDFIVDPARMRTGCVDKTRGHRMIAEKCFQCLNRSLRRNICNLPEDTIGSRPHVINDMSVIPEALQYACLHWASHLAMTLDDPPADAPQTLSLLSEFADGHLLHWFECLSAMGQLESGIISLGKKFSKRQPEFSCIAALFDDARRCLQMGFEVIQLHCLNTYYSALTWIPRRSIIREHYKQSLYIHRVLGLSDSWGLLEQAVHHPTGVHSVAISPDGSQIASGSDNTIRVWRATTGEIEQELRGHSGRVAAVAFSSDGSRIVTGSYDKTIRTWRVADWKIEHILKGHSRRVSSVAFSRDGTRVVSGSSDKTVRVGAADSGEIKLVLEGHSYEVTSVDFSDDSRIASGSLDHTIRIWDMHTGETVRVLVDHSDMVSSVAFSSDGSRLAGSARGTVRIWDTHTWQTVHVLDHSHWVNSVAFSPDGSHLVSGSVTVSIWSVSAGEIEHELEGHQGHQGHVTSVAFLRDGSHVVSGSWDGTVQIWNMETQRVLEHLSHLMDDHTRRIWHTVQVTNTMESYKMEQGQDLVRCLAFSPNGSSIVSGSGDTVRLWRASTVEVVHVLRHSRSASCVAFSPCGRRVVSGSFEGAVCIWSAITGQEESVFKGHSASVYCVEFSPCGGRVVSGSYDKTARIWNAATGEEERVLSGHLNCVGAVAFSHDGSRVASGSGDLTVRIWNVVTGETECILESHPDWIVCVAFSHDDNYVVSGAKDGTIRIWDTTSLEFTKSCQLPDGCRVNALGKGQFQILDPVDQNITIQVSLSSDLKWLLGGSRTHDCWIPTEYRHRVMALSGSKACIGYDGGQVVIIDLPTK